MLRYRKLGKIVVLFIYFFFFNWWGVMSCFESLHIWDANADILKKHSTQRFWYWTGELTMPLYEIKLDSGSCLVIGRRAVQADGTPWETKSLNAMWNFGKTKWNSQSRRNSEICIVVLLLDRLCGPKVGFDLCMHLFLFNLCTSPAWVVCK